MRLLQRMTQRLADFGALAIAAIIMLTVADVLMKNLFRSPIPGVFEVVELMLVITVFFGFPDVFRSEANICVDVADHLVGPRARSVLHVIGAVASLGFLLLLGWAMVAPAWDTVVYPQSTQEAGIPILVYWLPIILGTALTVVATAATSWSLLRRSKVAGDS